ncbi:MAG: PH domain-containing protein [Candidatus Marsarchaeota archaeon]|jgi:hypothetical protein|nr:PH domain-containing protein [Candidatus Marsarchaeota archaeon]MCL5419089.1 PH domain-containing protein [Candidatus Marsarchaeota archaeon]
MHKGFHNEEDLEILLLPGEHVLYKARRGLPALPLANWVIITNKRILLVHRRGFLTGYKSILYNGITQVSVHKGAIGSKVVISLEGKRLKSIMNFAMNRQALAVFSILSNQVSMKSELNMIYNSISQGSAGAPPAILDKNANSFSQVVEELEANSMIYAAMINRTERNNQSSKAGFARMMRRDQPMAIAKHSMAVGVDADERSAESVVKQASGYVSMSSLGSVNGDPGNVRENAHLFTKQLAISAQLSTIQVPISIERKVGQFGARNSYINAIATSEERAESKESNEAYGNVIPYAERARLNPERDMLIFKNRRLKAKLQ